VLYHSTIAAPILKMHK